MLLRMLTLPSHQAIPPRTQTRGEERLTAGKKNVKDEKGEERRDEGGVTA